MEKESLGMDFGVPKGVVLKPIPGINPMYVAGDDGYIYSYSQARTNIRKPKPFRLAHVRNDNYFRQLSLYGTDRFNLNCDNYTIKPPRNKWYNSVQEDGYRGQLDVGLSNLSSRNFYGYRGECHG